MKPARRRFLFIMIIGISLASVLLTGCSAENISGKQETGSLKMATVSTMPDEVKDAPISVQEGYQFAVANPEILEQFPCYCGCGKMGHTSNYACYIQNVSEDGEIVYDTHALGCSICVDITQDVMRLLKEDRPIPEIQTYIDNTYSQFGPSNLPSGQSQ